MSEIISPNFALILSTFVSLVAILVAAYQAHIQRSMKISEMYFNAQLKAYLEYYDLITSVERSLGEGEVRDIRPLLKASKKAALVSPEEAVNAIRGFLAPCARYLGERDRGDVSEETKKEFNAALGRVESCLRKQIFQYGAPYHKGKR